MIRALAWQGGLRRRPAVFPCGWRDIVLLLMVLPPGSLSTVVLLRVLTAVLLWRGWAGVLMRRPRGRGGGDR